MAPPLFQLLGNSFRPLQLEFLLEQPQFKRAIATTNGIDEFDGVILLGLALLVGPLRKAKGRELQHSQPE
jgi:hypothetical protein